MRGAIELPTIAIFTIIAGSLIVLLFVTISKDQGERAQEDTQARSLQFLDTLIKTASTSRDTKNNITIINEPLRFSCDESGVWFGYEGGVQLPLQRIIIFAPYELNDGQLRFFTLASDVPYRAANIIYLGGQDSAVYTAGNLPGVDMSGFGFELIDKSSVPRPSAKFRTIFIKSATNSPSWNELGIEPILGKEYGTAYWFNGTAADPSVYPSRELLYGAILSKDKQTYECVLRRYLQQVRFVNQVQWLRAQDLRTTESTSCQPYYYDGPFLDIEAVTQVWPFTLNEAKKLNDAEADIKFMNDNILLGDSCASIY